MTSSRYTFAHGLPFEAKVCRYIHGIVLHLYYQRASSRPKSVLTTSTVPTSTPQGLGATKIDMLEYFFNGNDLNIPLPPQAGETQEPPAPQILEGDEEDRAKDIEFDEDAITPSGPAYRSRHAMQDGPPDC